MNFGGFHQMWGVYSQVKNFSRRTPLHGLLEISWLASRIFNSFFIRGTKKKKEKKHKPTLWTVKFGSKCLSLTVGWTWIRGYLETSQKRNLTNRYWFLLMKLEARKNVGKFILSEDLLASLEQCFSTAGPRPGTGPSHQLYRAARGSPGICHFSFLSIFHE